MAFGAIFIPSFVLSWKVTQGNTACHSKDLMSGGGTRTKKPMDAKAEPVIRDLWKSEFESLLNLLRKTKNDAPLIAVVSVEDQLVEKEIINLLRRELSGRFRLAEFGFDRRSASLKTYLQTYAPRHVEVILASGLGRFPDAARRSAMADLNRQRDILHQFGCSIVVFLHRDMISEFVHQAGDFWDCRSGFFEFPEPQRARIQARILTQRQTYMRLLMQRLGTLDLRGILLAPEGTEADLEAVFVEPAVVAGGDLRADPVQPVAEPESLAFARLLKRRQRVVVLGGPGSGKSVLLKYVATILAQGPTVASRLLHTDAEVDWFPIVLPLATYATALQDRPDLPLSDYLPEYFWSREYGDRDDLAILFRQEFEAGRCIAMFDGLDEIPTVGVRLEVIEHIHDLVRRFPDNSYIVTSRSVGYERTPVGQPFRHLTLAPLSWSQSKQLVERWCQVWSGDSVESARSVNALLDMIEREEYLSSFASNPLLLTILVHLYLLRRHLPQRRGELYHLATAALTETWGLGRSLSGRPVLMHLDEQLVDERRIVELLGPVAFWMHQNHPTGRVSRHELVRRLADHFTVQEGKPRDRAWRMAEEFVTLLLERSGLIVEQAGSVAFVHRTFQEYLSARYLAIQPDVNEQALALLADPHWEEVLVLCGDILQGGYFQAYVRTLLQAALPSDTAGRNVLVAGTCLNSAGRHLRDAPLGQSVIEALIATVENPDISLKVRERCGEILGELGDPRTEQMVLVPAGPFLMGIQDIAAYKEPGPLRRLIERSMPAHQVFVDSFLIDRYPVTHAQYACFVEDGGYDREELWSREGWAWLIQQTRKRPAYWKEYGWNRPNYPVVGVSWYEAEAYARWAGKRLPTEAEWEKAARGTDGRLWPWGNEWQPDAANAESTLGRLTPVGMYPRGASPYGVLDLAGNVWEWTADWFAAYHTPDQPDKRLKVLRGGAWNTGREHTWCMARILSEPGSRVGSVGFRCVMTAKDVQKSMMSGNSSTKTRRGSARSAEDAL